MNNDDNDEKIFRSEILNKASVSELLKPVMRDSPNRANRTSYPLAPLKTAFCDEPSIFHSNF